MNTKIFNRLNQMVKDSPQLLLNDNALKFEAGTVLTPLLIRLGAEVCARALLHGHTTS